MEKSAINSSSTQIIVTSTRVAGEWNAVARIGAEVVGWACMKSRKGAEDDARKGAEQTISQRRQLNNGTAKLVDGLKPFLQKSAA